MKTQEKNMTVQETSETLTPEEIKYLNSHSNEKLVHAFKVASHMKNEKAEYSKDKYELIQKYIQAILKHRKETELLEKTVA